MTSIFHLREVEYGEIYFNFFQFFPNGTPEDFAVYLEATTNLPLYAILLSIFLHPTVGFIDKRSPVTNGHLNVDDYHKVMNDMFDVDMPNGPQAIV